MDRRFLQPLSPSTSLRITIVGSRASRSRKPRLQLELNAFPKAFGSRRRREFDFFGPARRMQQGREKELKSSRRLFNDSISFPNLCLEINRLSRLHSFTRRSFPELEMTRAMLERERQFNGKTEAARRCVWSRSSRFTATWIWCTESSQNFAAHRSRRGSIALKP